MTGFQPVTDNRINPVSPCFECMTNRIAQSGWNMIQAYARMKFGGVEIACPYYMHSILKGLGARVSIGKGFPEEIVEEANVFALVHKLDLAHESSERIRAFMVEHSLGIECSGYIAHVLHAIHGKSFFKSLTDDSFGAIFLRFRPFQKINVHLLQKSGKRIAYHDVKPEDIIVTRGGKHALLVYEIEQNDDNSVKSIHYTHSTLYYKQNGVRFGSIEMIDPSKPLEDQQWVESEAEENYTYQGYLEELPKNGIYRLQLKD